MFNSCDTSLKFFLIIRLIFGLYFHMNSCVMSFIARVYCVFLVVFIPFVTSVHFKFLFLFNMSFFFINIMSSIVTEERYFFKYFAAMSRIDQKMGRTNIKRDNFNIFIFIMIACRLFLNTSYWLWTKITYYVIFMSLVALALELENTLRIIIYGMMYQRMKLLRRMFENIHVLDTNEIQKKMILYTQLLSTMQRVHEQTQITVVIILFFFPKIKATLHVVNLQYSNKQKVTFLVTKRNNSTN